MAYEGVLVSCFQTTKFCRRWLSPVQFRSAPPHYKCQSCCGRRPEGFYLPFIRYIMKRTSRPKKGTHSACTCCSGQKQAHKRKNNDAPTSTTGKGPKKQKTHNILPLEANLDDDVNDNFSSDEETSVRLPAAPSTATTLGVQTSSCESSHASSSPASTSRIRLFFRLRFG
ncbi:hypothetical protein DPMN_109409 [Dreissena polymorpha]|uniref:Uncharacterized protein n=1 Tax=Dreissena polymorpha TaxID=45954 RepID=A0A9D4QMZ2_DREPO|nr:hypothetical protein DPMN_109409 [Dreissena polymorpha]